MNSNASSVTFVRKPWHSTESMIALFVRAESTALNPGVGKFLLRLFSEEQHSAYARYQLVVMLGDCVQCV
jgi:hypothetical protein